jgi:hypothetical protein
MFNIFMTSAVVRHHTSDVLTGLALGFGISYALYRQMFPGFTHPECDIMISELEASLKSRASATIQSSQQTEGTDQEALLHAYQSRQDGKDPVAQPGLPV